MQPFALGMDNVTGQVPVSYVSFNVLLNVLRVEHDMKTMIQDDLFGANNINSYNRVALNPYFRSIDRSY
jgi:hypothetical protein